MTTRLLVGDVFERMAQLEDGSFDLIVTSPPFLALRSYLPDGHPDKAKEIGSEATPADYLDTLLALTAEWRRLLAPHGSIAVELGDTYAGSGGAGGDYDEDGLREGQNRFRMDWKRSGLLPLSLAGIPDAYALSLEYGWNVLRRNAPDSPAGCWRVRNKKSWVRSNPPVGSLGTKNTRERSATSYITVACVGSSRWFDLDAVRTAPSPLTNRRTAVGVTSRPNIHKSGDDDRTGGNRSTLAITDEGPGGAPPLDWWHQVDAVIDRVLDEASRKAGRPNGGNTTGPKNETGNSGRPGLPPLPRTVQPARGVHIRRALEAAGLLPRGDFYDVSPKGYAGAHYAVWPPELVRLMIDEMCPRRVCRECGVPSRRLTETRVVADGVRPNTLPHPLTYAEGRNTKGNYRPGHVRNDVTTLGWSDCGHGNWRPGRILDPFVGSGTTLAVASGMGRDSVGIDLDERNADLARERVGMFLEVEYPSREVSA